MADGDLIMDLNKDDVDQRIDDLVNFLDGGFSSGMGHVNVNQDPAEEALLTVQTMGCTDCSRTPLACSVPTLHQGLDDYQ